MGAIATKANAVFRDYETDGVPASGAHDPVKSEIRDLIDDIDASLSVAPLTIQSFGGADDGSTVNSTAIANLYGALPHGSRLPFPLLSTGVYKFSAGAFGLPTGQGYIIDPAPNVTFSGMSSIPYASVLVTEDLKFSIPAVAPAGAYEFVAAANFKNAARNKSLFVEPATVDRSSVSAINATSGLTHQKLNWPSTDNWVSDTPAATATDSVTWSVTNDSYFHGSFVPLVVGKKTTCFFPSTANYLRVAIVQTTGGNYFIWWDQGNVCTFGVKLTGQAATTAALTYFDQSTNLNYSGDFAEIAIEPISATAFRVRLNGLDPFGVFNVAGTITSIGFGVFGAVAGPLSVPVQGWTQQSGGLYGNLRPFQFTVVGDSQSDPSFHGQWPWYAQEALNGSLGLRCTGIDNRAVSGETAYQQWVRLNSVGVAPASGFGTLCAVVAVGTNDIQGQTSIGSLSDTSASASSFIGTMYAIFNKFIAANVPVVCVIPALFYNQGQTPATNGQLTANYGLGAQYRAALKRLCAANFIRVVDLAEIDGAISGQLLTNADGINDPYLRDNIHPTVFASRTRGLAIAKAIAAVIAPRPDDIALMGGVRLGGDLMTGPIGIASYTVAGLPATATRGQLAYATNARVFNGTGTQETAGNGTGGLVSYNGSAWKLVGTNVTAAA